MHRSLLRNTGENRIARKLIMVIITFSSLITLITTGTQLYTDYRRGVAKIHAGIDSIRTGQIDAIRHSLWNLDSDTIQITLNSLLKMEGLEYLKITSDQMTEWEAGKIRSRSIISVSYPIYYSPVGDVRIGEMQISAGLDSIYHQLRDRALFIFFSNGIKTFLVAGITLIAFQLLVTRHLIYLSDFAREYVPGKSSGTLYLKRIPKKGSPPDELDQLVAGFNLMQEKLNDELKLIKKLEDQKRRAELLFTQYVDSIDALVYVKELDGRYSFLNRYAEQHFRINREDLQSREVTDFDFFDRETALQNRVHDERVLKSGRQEETEESGPPYFITLRFPLHDVQGNTIGVCGFSHDITRQKKAESLLRKSEEQLRGIFEAARNVAFVIATNKSATPEIVEFSPGAEAIFGYAKNEIIGRPVSILHHVEHEEGDIERQGEPEETQCSFSDQTYLYRKSGERFPVLFSTHPLVDDNGTVYATLEVSIDISEQKNLESKLQNAHKLESLGTLASGVAHEINNPVNGIMNYAQLIVDHPDVASQEREYAKEIIKESDRVTGIVRSLLTFAHKEEEPSRPTEIFEVIQSVLSLTHSLFRNDRISILFDVPNDLPWVCCRSQQIQQVLLNLMINARDALNERYPDDDPGKEIRIYASEMDINGKQRIRTTVEDSGSGIHPGVLNRIFDPFFTTKGRAAGTGLGLSISYSILQEHGGELTLDSYPGQGTRFYMDLPATAPQSG